MTVLIDDSIGYDGDPDDPEIEGTVGEVGWAELMGHAGGRLYGVMDPSSWRASPGAGDRQVALTPGVGFGHGVRDRTTETALLTLPAPPSGDRWHLISVRRDWQANRSSFETVSGTATLMIPDRETTPGVIDDQPLWLARVRAGQSQVQELIDLRVWGGDGGAYATHLLVLQYLNRIGTSIRIGGVRWDRVLNTQGQPEWVNNAPEAGQFNTVAGGGIVHRGTTGGIGNFTIAAVCPAGTLIRVFASCQIYCPGTVGNRVNNYGGSIGLYQGEASRGQRRWHNHGVEGIMIEPSALFQWVTTEDLAAGTVLNLGVSNDPTAGGGIELWDAFVSWSIERP